MSLAERWFGFLQQYCTLRVPACRQAGVHTLQIFYSLTYPNHFSILKCMKQEMWASPETDNLFSAILSLKNLDESRRFFRDLLTEPELAEFANRWKVAQLLSQKTPYSQIEKETRMSSTTIARISKWLTNGMGGYTLALNKLNHHHHQSTSFEEDS